MAHTDTASSTALSLPGYARAALVIALFHLAVGGAAAGGLLAARVAATGTAQTIPRIWAESHANSQIIGIIGLAVVALASSLLPRVKRAELRLENRLSLAVSCLVVGSVMHPVCHGLQERFWPDYLLMGSLTANFVELVGWAYFVAVFYIFLRSLPEDRQARFEKSFFIGAVWFGVGLAMVVLVRIMWLASAWVVSIHPRIHLSVRHLQLMTGAFLMVAGLAHPVHRGWPRHPDWRAPLLPESMLWSAILAAFLVSIASPLVGRFAPDWIPYTLLAAAVLDLWAVGVYVLCLTRLGHRAKRESVPTPSVWRGVWASSTVWLLLSMAGTAAAILWMVSRNESVSSAWLQLLVHAFALGFAVPTLVLTFRHIGCLWRGRHVGKALWILSAGLALYVFGFPWMLSDPGSPGRWMVAAGAAGEALAALFLAGQGALDLFPRRKPGC